MPAARPTSHPVASCEVSGRQPACCRRPYPPPLGIDAPTPGVACRRAAQQARPQKVPILGTALLRSSLTKQEAILEPRIIKTDEQYRYFLKEVEALRAENLDPDPDTAAGARLELLLKLIEDYEKVHFPLETPDPIEAILLRMGQRGLRQKDIADLLGGKNRASEVLARKRPLTLPMIRSLNQRLDIPAGLLIREVPATYAVSEANRIPRSDLPEGGSGSPAIDDVYFSADVETDGSIPGPYSLLSFGLVFAGRFDGRRFSSPPDYEQTFYRELKPISEAFEPEALAVNGLDRNRLALQGADPADAMTEAAEWVQQIAGAGRPVLVAFPLSFDWTWLYWYFVRYSRKGSPFNHSSCFDIKTAYAVKASLPIARAGKNRISAELRSSRPHTHNALDDAIEQAEIFSKIFRMGFAPRSSATTVNKNNEQGTVTDDIESGSTSDLLQQSSGRLAGEPGRDG